MIQIESIFEGDSERQKEACWLCSLCYSSCVMMKLCFSDEVKAVFFFCKLLSLDCWESPGAPRVSSETLLGTAVPVRQR